MRVDYASSSSVHHPRRGNLNHERGRDPRGRMYHGSDLAYPGAGGSDVADTNARSYRLGGASHVIASLWDQRRNRCNRFLGEKAVYVVFEQNEVIPINKLRNLLAAFNWHHRCRGIVHGRLAENELRLFF